MEVKAIKIGDSVGIIFPKEANMHEGDIFRLRIIDDTYVLTPKTAVTAFYEQIVEQKRIPFDLALSERQKKTRIIQRLAQDSLVRELDTDEKIEAWLNEE